jgi:hypothetical protein
MARAAGNDSHYTFVLKNVVTGKYDNSCVIRLPSVTTIIGEVLAKPMLVGWAYRFTRDAIAGTVNILHNEMGVDPDLILDTLSDGDNLEEYLKENQLRPDDFKSEAADRGTVAHDLLERIAGAYLEADEVAAERIAQRVLADPKSPGWNRAVAGWWLDRSPSVVESETKLLSLQHGFIGTVDLIWEDWDGNLTVTDLKSRKEGAVPYESDHIQCGAYVEAYEETTGRVVDRTTVLVVRADGSWVEETSDLDNRGIFLDLLSAYKKLKVRK